MGGFNRNAFLVKKLQTEKILHDDVDSNSKPQERKNPTPTEKTKTESLKEKTELKRSLDDKSDMKLRKLSENTASIDARETRVVIKEVRVEKRKIDVMDVEEESPVVKKKKCLPIVFDVGQKTKVRERTDSVGSNNNVTVSSTTSSYKYDSRTPMSVSPERKEEWCRAFPACRHGSSCAFPHPRCKFAAFCKRRDCFYSHTGPAPTPAITSPVVPAAKYKSISGKPLPVKCKFYPSCAKPACHYYHPKPCRYGNACGNKLECRFYHADVPSFPLRASSTYNKLKRCRYGNACRNKLECYFYHAEVASSKFP